jgi:hypothetical protein
MPIVRIFSLDLAGLCSQQVPQRVEAVFNPAPPAPGPDQARRRDSRGTTEQVVPPVAWLVNDDHRDGPLGRARGPQPGIRDPGQVEVISPGPVRPGQERLALQPAPVWEVQDIGALALHQQDPLLVDRYML